MVQIQRLTPLPSPPFTLPPETKPPLVTDEEEEQEEEAPLHFSSSSPDEALMTPIAADDLWLYSYTCDVFRWGYVLKLLSKWWQGGGLSAAVGYPLDTVKVRIQTERSYNGIWHCIRETYKAEKAWGFYKGMSLSVSTVSLVSSFSFGAYRNFLYNICRLRYGTSDVKPSKVDISVAGCATGAVRVVLISPTEIAKVRMQTQKQSHYSVTASHLSKPKYQGPVHCLRMIAKEEGFRGLYKGCSALLCRDCHSFATYFLTYSILCDWFTPAGKNKPDILTVLLSGGFAGVFGWAVATPMDVIKSRMQVDNLGQRKYRGLIHCIRVSVKEDGIRVLFKGLGLNCIRAFPVNMVVFVTYEAVMRLAEALMK
ncbi:solute carrier family 25 member 47 [Gopherus flavomarginatus]|uniref:solute carrier family 25 member 47 n=1 Tax=Gopherus flavomarginatus TaxID=286002 RepID=UPI0021CBC309|nr:solute carrier family 25 member 47 [Gopherus flavomarginatus]